MPAQRRPRRAGEADAMCIDPATRASLEIRTGPFRRPRRLAARRPSIAPSARPAPGRWRPRLSPPSDFAGGHRCAPWTPWPGSWSGGDFAPGGCAESSKERANGPRPFAPGAGRGGPRDFWLPEGRVWPPAPTLPRSSPATSNRWLRRRPKSTEPLATLPPRVQALAAFAETLRLGLGADLAGPDAGRAFVAGLRSAPDLDGARALRDDSRRVDRGAGSTPRGGESGVAVKIRHNGVLGLLLELGPKAEPLFRRRYRSLFIHRQTQPAVRFRPWSGRTGRQGSPAPPIRLLPASSKVSEAWRETARALARTSTAAAGRGARLDVAAAWRSGPSRWARFPRRERLIGLRGSGARTTRGRSGGPARRRSLHANDLRPRRRRAKALRAFPSSPAPIWRAIHFCARTPCWPSGPGRMLVPPGALRLGRSSDRLFSRVGAAMIWRADARPSWLKMAGDAAILTQGDTALLRDPGRDRCRRHGGPRFGTAWPIAWACAEALHDTNRWPRSLRHPLS